MVDCKICGHPLCQYAGEQRGFVINCTNYMPPQKPQTNADRIRAMSDEKLAAYFAALFVEWRKFEEAQKPPTTYPVQFAVMESVYYARLMELFRQPVRDGDNK